MSSVRWIVHHHAVHPSVPAAIVRDRNTGDVLVITPSEIQDSDLRLAIYQQLYAQLHQWEGAGLDVDDVRRSLQEQELVG